MSVSFRFNVRSGVALEYRDGRYRGSWVVLSADGPAAKDGPDFLILIARGKTAQLVTIPGAKAREAKRAAEAATKRSDYAALCAMAREQLPFLDDPKATEASGAPIM